MEQLDFTPKLVAFDLDGTLTESKQNLEPAMGALLGRLMEKIPVAVMSGANFDQFQKQFLWGMPNNLPENRLYIFPTNAGQCYIWQNGNWIKQYEHLLSKEERQQILDALAVALQKTGLDVPPPQVWGDRIEDRGAQISFSGLGQQAPIEEKKKWDPDHTMKKALYKELAPLLPNFSVRYTGMTTIDITKKGTTKAFGIEQLEKITGICISEMLYVGDALWEGGNDAVVKETGIRTVQVSGPQETAQFIESILAAA